MENPGMIAKDSKKQILLQKKCKFADPAYKILNLIIWAVGILETLENSTCWEPSPSFGPE